MKLLRLLRKFLHKLIFGHEEGVEPLPQPSDPPDMGQLEPPPLPGEGTNILLWKPHSDSTGTAVLLLPSWMRPSKLTWVKINGTFDIHPKSLDVQKVPDDLIWPNGDRIHIYFNNPGKYYGKAARIVVCYDGKSNHSPPMNAAIRFEILWGKE